MLSKIKRPSAYLSKPAHSFLFFSANNQSSSIDKAPPKAPRPAWILSDTVANLWQKGQQRQALDFHYEDLVRQKTGGTSKFIGIYEIDVVTNEALIQCKRSVIANTNPRQFIKDARKQINRTIEFAKERNLRAEFWFASSAAPSVIKYIEDRGGIFKSGLDEKSITLAQAPAIQLRK